MNARGRCLHGCGCERFCLSRAKSSKDGRICKCSHEEARHELLGTDHRSAVVTAFDALRDAVLAAIFSVPIAVPRVERAPVPRAAKRVASASSRPARGERAIMIAVAQYPEGCDRPQLSILTGYKRSTRDAYVQRLEKRGFVRIDGDRVLRTAEGVTWLGTDYEPLPTGPDLRDHWIERLPEGESVLLGILVGSYPRWVTNDVLTESTGYKRSTRDAYLQRLEARKLVERRRNEARVASALMAEH